MNGPLAQTCLSPIFVFFFSIDSLLIQKITDLNVKAWVNLYVRKNLDPCICKDWSAVARFEASETIAI